MTSRLHRCNMQDWGATYQGRWPCWDKGNFSVTVCNYSPIPDVASLATREINCDKTKEKVSDSALVLGIVQTAWPKIAAEEEPRDSQEKMDERREDVWFVRLIAKSGLSFPTIQRIRWQLWHSFMQELSSGGDSQVNYASCMVCLEL